MIYKDLYKKILIDPVDQDCDELMIVSGYASATMTTRHLFDIIEKRKKTVKLDLIIGMCPVDGLSISNHNSFKKIAREEYPTIFNCNYVVSPNPVHSKVYIWLKKGVPKISFTGSANYTQNAFNKVQLEVMTNSNPIESLAYYKYIKRNTLECTFEGIEKKINLYDNVIYNRLRKIAQIQSENVNKNVEVIVQEKALLEKASISLLTRTGTIHNKGGLNWGQREGRDKNQAYIQLPPKVYNSDFFPKSPNRFTVLTDDDKMFICVRAQKSTDGQAIHTPENNSYLGLYFRYRLGLESGQFVSKEDLLSYGRTDVEFTKIDDETFFMDFSI